MTATKRAHILTPPDSQGGFHPLCTALMNERWSDAEVSMGNRLVGTNVPALVVLAMRTDRAIDFGARAFYALKATHVPAFGMFTTMDGIRTFIDAGLPDILGERMRFAVIEGLAPVPTGWPREICVIRISNPPNDTNLSVVRRAFLDHIGPARTAMPPVDHHDDRHAAAS